MQYKGFSVHYLFEIENLKKYNYLMSLTFIAIIKPFSTKNGSILNDFQFEMQQYKPSV